MDLTAVRVFLRSTDPSSRCTHSIVTCVLRLGRSCVRQSLPVPNELLGAREAWCPQSHRLCSSPGHSTYAESPHRRHVRWSTFPPPVLDSWVTCWTKDSSVEERLRERSAGHLVPNPAATIMVVSVRAIFKVRSLSTPLMQRGSTGCTITSASSSTSASCSTWAVNLLMCATSPVVPLRLSSDFDVEGSGNTAPETHRCWQCLSGPRL